MTNADDIMTLIEAALTEREDEIARLHALVEDAYREGYADAARDVYDGMDGNITLTIERAWRASTARRERDR